MRLRFLGIFPRCLRLKNFASVRMFLLDRFSCLFKDFFASLELNSSRNFRNFVKNYAQRFLCLKLLGFWFLNYFSLGVRDCQIFNFYLRLNFYHCQFSFLFDLSRWFEFYMYFSPRNRRPKRLFKGRKAKETVDTRRNHTSFKYLVYVFSENFRISGPTHLETNFHFGFNRYFYISYSSLSFMPFEHRRIFWSLADSNLQYTFLRAVLRLENGRKGKKEGKKGGEKSAENRRCDTPWPRYRRGLWLKHILLYIRRGRRIRLIFLVRATFSFYFQFALSRRSAVGIRDGRALNVVKYNSTLATHFRLHLQEVGDDSAYRESARFAGAFTSDLYDEFSAELLIPIFRARCE